MPAPGHAERKEPMAHAPGTHKPPRGKWRGRACQHHEVLKGLGDTGQDELSNFPFSMKTLTEKTTGYRIQVKQDWNNRGKARRRCI